MSRELISRSPDLRRLVADGYQVAIRSTHLVLRRIPYVREDRTVAYGDLVVPLSVTGHATSPPTDHTVYFRGDYPCDERGRPIEAIRMSSGPEKLAPGVRVDHRFSAKPHGGAYRDHHHQLTHYARILGRHVRNVAPGAAARSDSASPADDSPAPFLYHDTASSRAGVTAIHRRVAGDRIGIVGLGGTGSYILDYLSKAPVAEIHLFDGDDFEHHNAFRAPGAFADEDIERAWRKVETYAARYSRMRTGIIPHPVYITSKMLPQLTALDFLFVAVDDNETRRWLFPALQRAGVAFMDVGMGVEKNDDRLTGILRTSLSTEEGKCHAPQMRRIQAAPAHPGEAEYRRNIQIVELNALNAALAVIRWKKYRGLYADGNGELQSTYTLAGNHLVNNRRSDPVRAS